MAPHRLPHSVAEPRAYPAAWSQFSPPSGLREENLQKNSATISALPRRVMPCSRESCSAMAGPTGEGVSFHPSESGSRDVHTNSPPLVSKVTTQRAVGPSAQARRASRRRPTRRVLQVLCAPDRAGPSRRRSGWACSRRSWSSGSGESCLST